MAVEITKGSEVVCVNAQGAESLLTKGHLYRVLDIAEKDGKKFLILVADTGKVISTQPERFDEVMVPVVKKKHLILLVHKSHSAGRGGALLTGLLKLITDPLY